MKKKERKAFFIIFALIFIVLTCWMLPNYYVVEKVSNNYIGDSFSFGIPEGFYDKNIELRLSANDLFLQNEDIYYTLDGSKPTIESSKYSEPIALQVDEGIRVVPVRAIVCKDGEVIRGPYTGTYVLSKNIQAFQDVLIVSIVAEKDDLFDSEKGILYPAISYVTTGDGERYHELHSQNFAQKGEEWVRAAHVTMFDNGKKVIAQKCGVSVSGNHGSLIHYPFSLNIKADTGYEMNKNTFAYDFFGEGQTPGASVEYYDSISFKNGGNDYAWNGLRDDVKGTMLRNSICTSMAEELGILTSKHRMAIVFLNGEFYNITSLNANFNKKTIARKTGLNNDHFAVQKGGESVCTSENKLKRLYLNFPEIEKSEIFEEWETFEQKVDMQDLFRYYSFGLIIGNGDWPHNNCAMWRYTGEKVDGNPYSDGKYRYWLFDTDCCFSLQEYLGDPWEKLFEPENMRKENCLIPTIVQIKDFRIQFVNTVLDQLNSKTFSNENIKAVIEKEDNLYAPWYRWVYGEAAEADRQKNLEILEEKMLSRKEQVYNQLEKYFQVDSLYTLKICKFSGSGNIYLNSIVLKNEEYSGKYDADYPVSIVYEKKAADELKGWLVNGEKTEAKELIITKDMIQNNEVIIQPIIDN